MTIMDDEKIAEFTSVTAATPELAQQYLTLGDNDVAAAIQLFFESGGVDMGASYDAAAQPQQSAPPVPPVSTRPPPSAGQDPISLDSDEENSDIEDLPKATDDDEAVARKMQEDDEAMARRLQEEAYGGGGMGGGQGAGADQMDIDPETGVRRPMARTHETLAGPSSGFVGGGVSRGYDDEEELQAAVREQMAARQRDRERPGILSRMSRLTYDRAGAARAGNFSPGIFNQRNVASGGVASPWDEADSLQRRETLSRSTGGASQATEKSNRLAEMYRPPFELMASVSSLDGLRAMGKEENKWILLNIQSPNIFDCQVLNRDIWKNEQIRQTVKENFVFKQFNKNDPQAQRYNQYYFKDVDNDDAYPHIAIMDPRTGERTKVWSGPPAPKATEFLSELHEYLDRYTLDASAKNPIAKRKSEKKKVDVDKMSEEEMMEMAIQSSLNGKAAANRDDDPDHLTKHEDAAASSNGDAQIPKIVSPFNQISASNAHTEPAADAQDSTRIQFRHPGGRVIRRFAMRDPVRRIYEWLKAAPIETREGQPFELVFMGKNLIDSVDDSIEEAGLKNGSVMVEFVEE